MFLYTNEYYKLHVSYENLWDWLNKTDSISKYIYTKNTKEVIFCIAFAAVNKNNIILLDGDFTESELKNLDIENFDLQEKCYAQRKIKVSNLEDFCKTIKSNIDDVKIGIFTSGTTGKPKRFEHTLASLLKNIKIADKHKNDVWALAYNITHFAGVQVLLQAIMNGNHLVDVFGVNAANANDILKRYGCNCISATPTYFRNYIFVNDKINKTIMSVTFGGEKFGNDISEKVKRKFPNAKLRNIYASTEVGSLLSGSSEFFYIPQNLKEKIIIDKNCHLLLHKDLLENMHCESDWYDTGDVAELNKDGSFKILSRDCDFINVGGYKVNPLEVEQEILNVPEVIDVVVYGRANSVVGEIVVADIVVSSGVEQEAVKKKVMIQTKEKLQAFKCPQIVKVVYSINKSRSGKKVR